jgi:hypothetical protein
VRIATSFVVTMLAASFGIGCARPPEPPPMSAVFRPAPGKAHLWLTTPIAIEVESERDARVLEAAECEYIGEIAVRNASVRRGDMALVAAQYGATHYRPTVDGIDRTSLVLCRIERQRWGWLPDELRPAPAAL